MRAALTNHPWQPKIFAGIVGLLTIAFRTNDAQIRHYLRRVLRSSSKPKTSTRRLVRGYRALHTTETSRRWLLFAIAPTVFGQEAAIPGAPDSRSEERRVGKK